jgi:hypothetical protein
MNFLAASLLRVFSKDYEAFMGLQYIMRKLNWRNLYMNNTPKLTNMCDLLFSTLADRSPALH